MAKAVQIFDVLRSVGAFHSFSAGLVIGGKNLKDERERLARMNILVATPGRLLQHMDQTFGFECDNLQVLSKFRTVHLCQELIILAKFWTKRIAY
jgi:ATP-dependent RNA helicase DDX10/DBP4